MRARNESLRAWLGGMAIVWLTIAPGPAHAQRGRQEGRSLPVKEEFEGLTPETAKMLYRMYNRPVAQAGERGGPLAVPDIFGHGAVLTVGQVNEKVTNFGFNG